MGRLMALLAFVTLATILGGLVGGLAGYEVGRLSPSFVRTLGQSFNPQQPLPSTFVAREFGMGLGIVFGFFFGSGAGLFLVVLTLLRDAWQARLELARLMNSRAKHDAPGPTSPGTK